LSSAHAGSRLSGELILTVKRVSGFLIGCASVVAVRLSATNPHRPTSIHEMERTARIASPPGPTTSVAGLRSIRRPLPCRLASLSPACPRRSRWSALRRPTSDESGSQQHLPRLTVGIIEPLQKQLGSDGADLFGGLGDHGYWRLERFCQID